VRRSGPKTCSRALARKTRRERIDKQAMSGQECCPVCHGSYRVVGPSHELLEVVMPTDKALARIHAQLGNVIQGNREVIDGVDIDLRNEMLPWDDWKPSYLIDFGTSPEPPSEAPFIWFPWLDSYDEDAVRRQAQAIFDEKAKATNSEHVGGHETDNQRIRVIGETSRRSEASIDAYIRANTPECVVQKGDKISVDRVEVVPIGNTFDHLHDREIRAAYLRVERPNGEIEKLTTPITYKGRTAIRDSVVSNLFVNSISARILRYFGLGSIRDLNRVPEDESYAYRALRKAFSVDIATKRKNVGTVIVVGRGPSEEFHDGSNTWYTVNDAVMMGYLWGRAEAAQQMQPLAEWALATKEKSARGGKFGGANRRKRAQEGWMRIAEKIAEELWQTNAKLTQADVIRKIPDRWAKASADLELSGCPAPSDSRLKTFISEVAKGLRQQPDKVDSKGVH
jgi:hypothetical protein